MVAPETKKAVLLTIPGIGKAIIVEAGAPMGRNPGTGEVIKIPV